MLYSPSLQRGDRTDKPEGFGWLAVVRVVSAAGEETALDEGRADTTHFVINTGKRWGASVRAPSVASPEPTPDSGNHGRIVGWGD